ncbi:hypothetical protein [Nocardioides pacificus]
MSPMNDDRIAELLGDDLHRQVAGMHEAPLTLGDVRGRAGRIRRNRRIAAGAGALAALAVVAPTVLLLGGNGTQSKEIDPVTPTEVVEREPVRTTLTSETLEGLERGEDPAIEYFTPEGVVLPGEGLVELDQSYQAMVWSEADGQWWALSPSRDEVRYLSEDFSPQGGSATNQDLVTSDDRSTAAWTATEAGGQTLYLRSLTEAGQGSARGFPVSPLVQALGVLGDDRVVYARGEGEDVDFAIAGPGESDTTLDGVVAVQATASAEDLVAVQTAVPGEDGEGACFGVIDVAADPGVPAWDQCTYKLRSFSPDGRYVLADSVYSEGLGSRELYVLDARSGELVASYEQPRNGQLTLVQAAWEPEGTVLATVIDGDQHRLVRLGTDGLVEQAADTATGPYEDLYYYLGADRSP